MRVDNTVTRLRKTKRQGERHSSVASCVPESKACKMCRVSTLRNVEPLAPKYLKRTEHLPRIEEAQGVRLPLSLIEEDGSADFTLPFQVETKLPKISPLMTPILDFEETIVLEENENGCSATQVQEKEGTDKVDKLDKLPAARCPTPFFKGNDTNKNLLKKKGQATCDVVTPQLKKIHEAGKENSLERPKLRSTLSCPEVNTITPTPPKSPLKHRPSTPFMMNRGRKLLARSRSLDSKGLGETLQAWSETVEETSLGTDSPENAADIQKASCATKIGFRRKIDRDKKMLPDLEESAKPSPDGSSSPPCKIRMDKDVFNKWIREQRVS